MDTIRKESVKPTGGIIKIRRLPAAAISTCYGINKEYRAFSRSIKSSPNIFTNDPKNQ